MKLIAIGMIGFLTLILIFPIPYKADYYWYHVVQAEKAHEEGWGYSESGNRYNGSYIGDLFEATLGHVCVNIEEDPLIECKRIKPYTIIIYGLLNYLKKTNDFRKFIYGYKQYWHDNYDNRLCQ